MNLNAKHYVFLEGGLGNQLYMIAYANFLKEQGHTHVQLITRPVRKTKGDTKDKKKRWLLTEIPHLLGVQLLFFWHRYIFSFLARTPKMPLYRQLWSKILTVHQEPFRKWHVFMPQLSKIGKYNLHIGYFQSYRYISNNFLERTAQLIEQLAPKTNAFAIHNNDVAIHIRRGDFLTNGNDSIFAKIELSYYLKALDYIAQRQPIGKLYVFSDDFQAIKTDVASLKNNYELITVEGQSVLEDINTLQKFHNFVLGNSTFSWWGAMLSLAENKTVIVPKKTLQFEMTNATPFPPKWIVVEN